MNRSQTIIIIAIVAIMTIGFYISQVRRVIKEEFATSIPVEKETKHGEVKQFTSDGRLKTVVNYNNGIKEGFSYLYYDDGKTVMLAIPYHLGKREGTSYKYYNNGNIYAETNYQNDLLHGKRMVYYKSGKTKSEIEYYQGNPGTGLKEFLLSGKEKESYRIQYEQIRNEIRLSITPDCKRPVFYIGSLINERFFDPLSSTIKMLPEKDNIFFINLNTYTSSFLQYQDIICSCDSSQGNPIVVKTRIEL